MKSLWPVIIIIVGIAFLPIHNALRIFLALIVVALSIFGFPLKSQEIGLYPDRKIAIGGNAIKMMIMMRNVNGANKS